MAEDVSLSQVAEQFGTPTYVYSRATLERHWKAFDQSVGDFPHLVCYAVKANSNIGVLNALARLALALISFLVVNLSALLLQVAIRLKWCSLV